MLFGAFMRTSSCVNLFDFPYTLSNILFDPTMITIDNVPSIGQYLIKYSSNTALLQERVAALHSMAPAQLQKSNPILAYFLNSNEVNLEAVTDQIIAGGFNVYSIASRARNFFVLGALYRCIQIATVSAHNKVKVMEMNPYLKFACITAIAVTPAIAMHFLGYSTTEVILAGGVRVVSSYLMPTKWGSKVREMDLVSDKRDFHPNNLVLKNTLSFLRNLVTSALTDYVYFAYSSNIANYMGLARRDKSSIGVCLSSNGLRIFGYGANALPVYATSLLFTEIGWSLGRLLVDSFVALLRRFEFISDARDPLWAVFNPTAAALKKENERHLAGLKNVEEQKPSIKSAKNTYNVNNTNDNNATQFNYLTQISLRQTTQKTLKAPKDTSKHIEVALPKVAEHHNILAIREYIGSANLAENLPIKLKACGHLDLHPLVLNHDVLTTNALVYGTIVNRKATNYNAFHDALMGTTIIGNKRGVNSLGNDVFYIRTPLDTRMLGYMWEGKKLYNVLRDKYAIAYEDALHLENEFTALGRESKMIIFESVTDHDKFNMQSEAYLRRIKTSEFYI